MAGIARKALSVSHRINWVVERVCVALLVILGLDVWLGVLVRYVIPLPLTFTEELARYLMIWMALLAVSSGIVHREHIGVEVIFERMPAWARRWLAVAFDVIAFSFFAVLFWYGLDFVDRGFKRITMIYEIPKAYPFMGVPLAAGMACIQLFLIGIHDFFAEHAPEHSGAAITGPEDDLARPCCPGLRYALAGPAGSKPAHDSLDGQAQTPGPLRSEGRIPARRHRPEPQTPRQKPRRQGNVRSFYKRTP